MNQSTCRHRRFAALVLVAIVWFVPAIAGAAAAATDKLQVLVNDTAAQLQLAYRQHPDERALRQEQLTAAVAAWRAAPRSEANNEKLATWLRAAMLSSMPGSTEPLRAVPSFAAIVKVEPQPVVREVVKAAPQPEVHEVPAQPQAVEKEPKTVEKQPEAVEKESVTVEKQPEATEKQPEAVEKVIEKQAPVETVAKPARENDDDPFRDDPVNEGE